MGVERFMPSRLMTEGLKAGDLPSSMALAQSLWHAVLGALGDQDVGQSVVVQAAGAGYRAAGHRPNVRAGQT